ncbi:MAG TPA: cytochrome C oxidase subunit IV family protein [Phycisphaeraceae bacterium]
MAQEIVSTRVYYRVAVALFVLLGLTILAAEIHLGPLAVVVAMLIAGVKAALVGLYFMHLRMSSVMMRLFALGGLLWFLLLLGGTLNDYFTRLAPPMLG